MPRRPTACSSVTKAHRPGYHHQAGRTRQGRDFDRETAHSSPQEPATVPHFWATMQFGTVPYLSLPVVVLLLAALALAFDFTNGIHDAANSIATVVSTRMLSPSVAVAWAAFFNFVAFGVFHLRVANDGDRPDRPQHRRQQRDRGDLAVGHLVESVHVVSGSAHEFVACADLQPDWCGLCQRRLACARVGRNRKGRRLRRPLAGDWRTVGGADRCHRDVVVSPGQPAPRRKILSPRAVGVGRVLQPGAWRQRRSEDDGRHLRALDRRQSGGQGL